MRKLLSIIAIGLTVFLGWFLTEKPEPPFGAVKDELIKYSTQVNTDSEKIEFSIRAEELLRLEHNIMGAKFRNSEITEAQWNNYLRDEFMPRSRKLGSEIGRLRGALGINSLTEIKAHTELEGYKSSTKYQINIKDILK